MAPVPHGRIWHPEMLPFWTNIAVTVVGLCIGSFLNVCIHRLPASRSIVWPGSMCPSCGTPLRAYDNIPVLSYLWLRGHCRSCGASISARYPLVELLGGALALASWRFFGPTPAFLVHYLFLVCLVVITFIDLDHRIIPDVISLPGIPVFAAAAVFLLHHPWRHAATGILLGGGSLWAVAWAYQFLTGKEGMGGGDIKLLAMIGALIGWQGVVFTILAASVTGSVTGIAVMRRTGGSLKLALPFGPFLALGAAAYVFWGPRAVAWYLGMH